MDEGTTLTVLEKGQTWVTRLTLTMWSFSFVQTIYIKLDDKHRPSCQKHDVTTTEYKILLKLSTREIKRCSAWDMNIAREASRHLGIQFG